MGHLVAHFELELLDKGVGVVVGAAYLGSKERGRGAKGQLERLESDRTKDLFCAAHQPADLFLSVGRRASRGLDHGGGLVICQFLDTSLSGYNVAHLTKKTKESDTFPPPPPFGGCFYGWLGIDGLSHLQG